MGKTPHLRRCIAVPRHGGTSMEVGSYVLKRDICPFEHDGHDETTSTFTIEHDGQ